MDLGDKSQKENHKRSRRNQDKHSIIFEYYAPYMKSML